MVTVLFVETMYCTSVQSEKKVTGLNQAFFYVLLLPFSSFGFCIFFLSPSFARSLARSLARSYIRSRFEVSSLLDIVARENLHPLTVLSHEQI